jgi:hypothetical protein
MRLPIGYVLEGHILEELYISSKVTYTIFKLQILYSWYIAAATCINKL